MNGDGKKENEILLRRLKVCDRIFHAVVNTLSRKVGGRPETSEEIKGLVLKIKNENLMWGIKRIQGELKKVGKERGYDYWETVLRVLHSVSEESGNHTKRSYHESMPRVCETTVWETV